MKILVTGSTGLVGSNLIKRLEKKHEVLGVARRTGIDLLDKEGTYNLITSFKPDVVYHLAAQAAESRGQKSPIDMTERNINIFLHVLVPSIAVKVKRFIYTSSVSVYGDAETPYTEDQIPQPKDIYGINKYAAEQMLKLLGKQYNIPYTIFRPHNMYGPHQDMRNPYKNVVALFMRSMMEEKEVTIFGEGKMRRAFSYIDDVIDVMVDALDKKYENQILNVGSSVEYSIEQLLEMIESIAGKKMKVRQLPARPNEVYLFISNNRKMRMFYDYKETPLREGLQKTWDFINLPAIKEEHDEL